jgi:hypothetical protein
MLSQKRIYESRIYAETIVYKFFVSMINPKYRGVNFKFSELEIYAESQVKHHFPLTYHYLNSEKIKKEMLKYAIEHAKYIARNILKESDIENWLNQ